VKIVRLMIIERSTVQRTTRRGLFLTVARARERIAIYISSYSNITYRAQKKNDRVVLNKRPESIIRKGTDMLPLIRRAHFPLDKWL